MGEAPRELEAISVRTAIRRLLTEFRHRGWRETGDQAVRLATAAEVNARELTSDVALPHVSDSFCEPNGAAREVVANAAAEALRGAVVQSMGEEVTRPIVAIDDIDSFSAVVDVPPGAVEDVLPLVARLPERGVKESIASILGLAHIANDWGGERDDIHSTLVVFNGVRCPTSFALKGRGTSGELTPKKMGKNGDQISRLVSQPSDLFVVQYVGPVASSIHEQLRAGIDARRLGGRGAVGSVWDGTDTARLLVAYGFLDLDTGELTDKGRRYLAG